MQFSFLITDKLFLHALDVKITIIDKEITAWGDILLVQKMLDRMDFDGYLDKLPLPAQVSNRGYSPDQLIKQFMCSAWCGVNRFEHTEVTPADEFVRQFLGFQRMAGHKAWWKLADGLEIGESVYQSPLWQAPRRIVMVRQHVSTRPKATGRQLRLFAEQGIYKNYRYSCYITSLDLSAELVWELYKKRADAENRIKELK